MKKTTKLRLVGGVVLLFNLWFIGRYNLSGIAVLLLTFGFAAGYEYFFVRPASKAAEQSDLLNKYGLPEELHAANGSTAENQVVSNNKYSKATPVDGYQATIDEDRLYCQIAEELESNTTDKGLWTRIFAECGGDEKQTKVLYIKQRAERLIAAERFRLEQIQTVGEIAPDAGQLKDARPLSLDQQGNPVFDPGSPQVTTTNIPSVCHTKSDCQQSDKFAAWLLVVITVGISLLVAVLMLMR